MKWLTHDLHAIARAAHRQGNEAFHRWALEAIKRIEDEMTEYGLKLKYLIDVNAKLTADNADLTAQNSTLKDSVTSESARANTAEATVAASVGRVLDDEDVALFERVPAVTLAPPIGATLTV